MNKAMSIPTVSIIIPVHNVAPYLETCLDSLLSQTFQDWEAVCIDDGSSDESPAMLDRYAARDARFKVVHQKNGGVSNARNTGLKLAAEPYIQMLDPDDWAEPDMTERLLRMIESTHAELGVCGCFYHHTATGETGRRMPDRKLPPGRTASAYTGLTAASPEILRSVSGTRYSGEASLNNSNWPSSQASR